ncbi:MAG: FHA domain-containing protein [Pirellulales bacterium]|nr:FHA domain-containing protein [Pirellulales bacterium]
MQATFVVIEPQLTPHEYTLDLPVTIGRGREANLKFSHGLISRRHCELVEDDGGIRVRDLGSRNGTFVGGNRVESASLAPGELLTVGGITLQAFYGVPEDVKLAPEKSAAEAALAETLPMDDTVTVQAKLFAEVAGQEEWPVEQSSLEMKGEEIEWLDESQPQAQSTAEKSSPQKPSEADDDFNKFLEGLRE